MPYESIKKKKKLRRETALYIAQRQTYTFPEMGGVSPHPEQEKLQRDVFREKPQCKYSYLGQPTGYV